jgi:hypothetical protein
LWVEIRIHHGLAKTSSVIPAGIGGEAGNDGGVRSAANYSLPTKFPDEPKTKAHHAALDALPIVPYRVKRSNGRPPVLRPCFPIKISDLYHEKIIGVPITR